MRFNYQGRTKNGEVRTGQLEASSRNAATMLLQKNDLYITFLEEAAAPAYAKRIKLFERTSNKDIVLFSRQLAIMFKSKVPLVESLRVLSTQSKNISFREKLIKISEDVEGGTSFSKAITPHHKLFSPFYVAMVKSGEISGKLSEVLEYLSEHLEREYHLMSKAKGAMVYPALILLVVALVLILMVYFVIPNLTNVLIASGEELPGITAFVIAASIFLREWVLLIVFLLVAIIIGFFRYYKTDKGQRFFHRFLLKIPLVGSLIKMIYTVRFSENLSTLISGGLPIAQAIETVGNIITNTEYKKVIFETRDEVRKGETISSVLSKYPDLFSPVFVQMVIVGEKTGTLDSTLMNIVDFYRKETDRSIDSLLSIMEPLLIMFLGLIVAGLMFSILMPLYKMVSL